MVQLARVVKDAQMDKKHCYHCSSPKHFIHNCPLIKTTRDKKQVNGKEGMAMVKGAWGPPATATAPKRRLRRCKDNITDSLLESEPFPAMVWDRKM